MSKVNKKKKQKKLRSLVLLLFLTIVMLTTSTYAWFTANKTVTIEPINVHVAASSGLQISTNASVWKTIITNEDIVGTSGGGYTGPEGYTSNVNILPTELVPVSTAKTIDTSTGYMKMYLGTVAGAANLGGNMGLTATQDTTTESLTGSDRVSGNYVAFDIFLKVDTASKVYLKTGSGVTETTANSGNGLQYAARYAFVTEGNTTSTDPSVAQALKSGSKVDLVEPNYDAHTVSGTANANQYYSITAPTATSGAAAIEYYGVDGEITTPILLLNTNPGGTVSDSALKQITGVRYTNVAFSNLTDTTGYHSFGYTDAKTGTPYTSAATNNSKYMQIFDLPAGITKLRVYMWIEGQDVDCENNASGSYLTYNITLTLLESDTATE